MRAIKFTFVVLKHSNSLRHLWCRF